MPFYILVIDYILGIIMWTLIGRVAMNIFQREDSQFFFMRVFVKFTNPLMTLFKPITPSFIIGFVDLTKIFIKKNSESSFWKIFIAVRPIKVHIIIPKI